jgi:tRNA (uracil-5-)-methyltransferase
VDAYCGSGLFCISIAGGWPQFHTVAGIEISKTAIKSAQANAQDNGVGQTCSFKSGSAWEIFSGVTDYPPDETVLIIDPPRKVNKTPLCNELCQTPKETTCAS